jgi:outer membrane protein assembly factor BamB
MKIDKASLVTVVGFVLSVIRATDAGAAALAAEHVIQQTGVSAGLAVVVGTTDGALEAGLTQDGKLLVHGLALSDDAAAKARKHLFDQKRYGLASVSRVGTVRALPYYNRTVNLLVADLDALGDGSPAPEEIQRVLGYEGVAYLKKGGLWTKTHKPTPQEVAPWTHARCDASRNATSKDRVVGPPNALRWVGGLAGRSSMSGPRTSDGVFIQYAPDAKPPGEKGEGFFLWARDVNSGVLLWKRLVSPVMPVTDYSGWSDYGVGDLLVSSGGRVYTYDLTQETCALTAFDVRTGEIRKVFDTSAVIRKSADPKAKTPTLSRDALRALTRSTVAVEGGKVIQLFDKNLYVMDAATAEVLWKKIPSDGTQYRYVVAGDGLLIAVRGQAQELTAYKTSNMFFAPEALECYQLQDGKPLWTFKDFRPDLAVMNDLFALSGGYLPLVGAPENASGHKGSTNVVLLDARKGTPVWNKPFKVDFDHQRQRHLRILGNDLWYHPFPSTSSGVCVDLMTGAEKRKVTNHRNRGCSGHTATPNYLIMQKSFHPLGEAAGQPEAPKYYTLRCFNPYCGERLTPSYGSVYCLLSLCPCETFLPGSCSAFYAVAPVTPIPDAARLEKAAMGTIREALPRQTAQQSAVATAECGSPAALRFIVRRFAGEPHEGNGFDSHRGLAWQTYQRDTTPPVPAGDLSLVAYVHEHRLAALRGGKEVWNFIAGGRITSEPAIHGNLALFGCHDGYVYAVQAKDGAPAWRFLAAPADKRHVAFGQVESVWPVFNVALDKGKAYCVAGRHGDLDGGLHIYCLDPTSGAVVWHITRQRGLTTDRHTPFTGPKGGGPINTYHLNDPIEVRDNKIFVRGEYIARSADRKHEEIKRFPPGELMLVDLAAPKDVIVNPETLVPPWIKP